MEGKPGEYVMQMLFADFSGAADRKIEQILQYYVNTTITNKTDKLFVLIMH